MVKLFESDPDAKDAKAQKDAEAKLRVRRRDRDGAAEELRTVEAKIALGEKGYNTARD